MSRTGYEVRNNTVYFEWQDVFPGGNRRASRYAYPVSIALSTTVNVETDIKADIKNSNLTGLSYDITDGQRFLIVDFTMLSRWPNNLTLDADSGYISLPGYAGSVEAVSYTLPTCVKTDGSSYQNGQLKIAIGDVCNVVGTYAFNFDTNCFSAPPTPTPARARSSRPTPSSARPTPRVPSSSTSATWRRSPA